MPTQVDRNAQAWMNTQAGELMRKKRTQEGHSPDAESRAISKRYEFIYTPRF